MEMAIQIHGKSCCIKLSEAAKNALALRDMPLVAEMEITLACMIKKLVRFHEDISYNDTITVSDILRIRLVSGEHCGISEETSSSQTTHVGPITNWKAIVPQWLKIDYHKGGWTGEFGYGRF